MRPLIPALLIATVLVTLSTPAHGSIKPGDTYAAVIAEKGKPLGAAGAGKMQILTFADEVVTLREGVVTTVRPAGDSTTTVPDRKVTDAERRRAAEVRPVETKSESSGLNWTTDYDAALASARSQNRKVFLFFTGSDWCGWCMKLNREILSTPEFSEYAGEHLVMVDLDFPRSKPQPDAERAQNQNLAQKYKITGYPTVIILSPEGRVVGRLGYREGGPTPFISALERL